MVNGLWLLRMSFLLIILLRILPVYAHETADFITQQNGSQAFKYQMKVPIGIRDKTPLYANIPNQTPLCELKKLITIERQKAGLSPHTTRNERDNLLIQTTWQKGTENFISSPMPACVKIIYVKPGQHVQVGEQIALIEAMKMENTLRANHSGITHSILCTLNNTVKPGDNVVSIIQWENIHPLDISNNKQALISLFSSSDGDSSSGPPSAIPNPLAFKFSRNDIDGILYVLHHQPIHLSMKNVYQNLLNFMPPQDLIKIHSHRRIFAKEYLRKIARSKPCSKQQTSSSRNGNVVYPLLNKPKAKKPPLQYLVKYFVDETLKLFNQNPRINIQPLSSDPYERLLQGIFGIIFLSFVFRYVHELNKLKPDTCPS